MYYYGENLQENVREKDGLTYEMITLFIRYQHLLVALEISKKQPKTQF